MKRAKKVIMLLVCAELVGFFLTYPALLADFQSISPDKEFAHSNCRRHLSISQFIALLPPSWISAPFLTGYYQHGFQWGC